MILRPQDVYVYRDLGPILPGIPTRWSPRKTECDKSSDHLASDRVIIMVKYRRDNDSMSLRSSTAMSISELLCALFIKNIGLECFEPVMVHVNDHYALSCRHDSSFSYTVIPGLHYGSIFVDDLSPAPEKVYDILERPDDLLRLWVLDSWLYNIDRATYGNAMLRKFNGKNILIAADQSDCFGGAISFSDDSFYSKNSCRCVDQLKDFGRIILDYGVDSMHDTADKIRYCVLNIQKYMDIVPNQWWIDSQIDKDHVMEYLSIRSDKLADICDFRRWEGAQDAIRGGTHIQPRIL